MKNKLISFIPVFFLFAFISNLQVKFTNPQVNLGKIERNKQYKETFEFENTGDEPLLINHINTSCGCAKASYSKEPIQPGQKGEVTILYKPKKTDLGYISKSIIVDFNDGKLRDYIYLKGIIE